MADPRRPIVWSPDARADLSEIWNYYVNVAGRQTADKIVGEIGEACRLLEAHPSPAGPATKCGPGFDRLLRVRMSCFIA